MGTKEKLKVHIEFCERNNEDMDATSWGMEEGVIISGNEAKTFLKLIEQSTSQKETIDRLMDILQKTTETLMAVRRHGIREEEGYETVVTLLGESINESEQLLKETEPIDQ